MLIFQLSGQKAVGSKPEFENLNLQPATCLLLTLSSFRTGHARLIGHERQGTGALHTRLGHARQALDVTEIEVDVLLLPPTDEAIVHTFAHLVKVDDAGVPAPLLIWKAIHIDIIALLEVEQVCQIHVLVRVPLVESL